MSDYIDEQGVNHGPGVEIDGVVSAPVKTEYGPCLGGWRVPKYAEVGEMSNN